MTARCRWLQGALALALATGSAALWAQSTPPAKTTAP